MEDFMYIVYLAQHKQRSLTQTVLHGYIDSNEWSTRVLFSNRLRGSTLSFLTTNSAKLQQYIKEVLSMFENFRDWEISLVERVFERFSQWTQKWVGLDCFFWAKVITIMALMATTTLVCISIMEKSIIMPICWMIVFAGDFLTLTHTIPQTKEVCYAGLVKGLRSPFLITLSEQRLKMMRLTLLLAPILMMSMATALSKWLPLSMMFIATCGTNYPQLAFVSCTPLPPGKSKLRKGSGRLVEAIKQALAPDQEGMPVPA
jgi:hypothetical protein